MSRILHDIMMMIQGIDELGEETRLAECSSTKASRVER